MTGDFTTSENTKTVPTLTKEQAFELALKQIGAENTFGTHRWIRKL
jgi:hypothetical protein